MKSGDRIVVVKGKYTGSRGTYFEECGQLSCRVRIGGVMRTLRKTSVEKDRAAASNKNDTTKAELLADIEALRKKLARMEMKIKELED